MKITKRVETKITIDENFPERCDWNCAFLCTANVDEKCYLFDEILEGGDLITNPIRCKRCIKEFRFGGEGL